jgi:glutaredoxin
MALHPEDEYLATASISEVTIYTLAGCDLCTEAKIAIAPILHEFGCTLREVNVNDDPVLRERYPEVPVIFVGARKAAKYQVNVDQFRRRLRAALNSSEL